MATNVDKTLFPATQGLDALQPDNSEVEIEIVDDDDPDALAGGMEVVVDPKAAAAADAEGDAFEDNLVDTLEAGDVTKLATELVHLIEQDRNSRSDWEKAYVEGLKLLGLRIEERTEPWEGACGVFHPMITEAVVRFQAETITETFPAQGPVRTKILGEETTAKKEAATRVEEDMNYELTERMPEFRPEHERMLWSLPGTGSAFKKVYWDPTLGRQVSMFIPAEDMLLPYGTTDIGSAHRVTHIIRRTKNEIVRLQEAGFYDDDDIGDPPKTTDDIQNAKDKETGFSDINDERFVIYECHVDLVIEGDTLRTKDSKAALPYVFTMVKGSNRVLAIRRNWKEEDEKFLKRQHFVHYQYIPGFGAYGFGLFHLIGGFAKSATSIMRQLVDSGTLANLPGGLKTKGLRIKGDDTPIAPGEWRDVEIGSGNIKENILPLPYKEPSATLFSLLTNIVEEGRRFAATADMKIADMSAQAPVGTTLALLERQLKVLTAVQARVHFSLKQELGLLKGLIRDYTDDDYEYSPQYGPKRAKNADYDMVDVIPVSDPNAATMSQRVVQYQAVIQMAQMAPEIYDLPHLHRSMLEVLGIKNASKLVPLPEDMKPMDPVSENVALLKSEPVKAFIHQDHQSHIAVHMSAAQDPMLQQLIGQNPKAQQMMSAMMSHIAEHAAYAYRQKIEQQLGMALPSDDKPMPPEAEYALSSMMAKAAQLVLQGNQAQAAQQQAQQNAQDPLIMLQQKELELKDKEVAIKDKQVTGALAAKADELELREREVEIKEKQAGEQAGLNRDKHEADNEHRGMQIGVQIAQQRTADATAQAAAQKAPPVKGVGE